MSSYIFTNQQINKKSLDSITSKNKQFLTYDDQEKNNHDYSIILLNHLFSLLNQINSPLLIPYDTILIFTTHLNNTKLIYYESLLSLLHNLFNLWKEFVKLVNIESDTYYFKNIIDNWNSNLKEFLSTLNPFSSLNNLMFILYDFNECRLTKNIDNYILEKQLNITFKSNNVLDYILHQYDKKDYNILAEKII